MTITMIMMIMTIMMTMMIERFKRNKDQYSRHFFLKIIAHRKGRGSPLRIPLPLSIIYLPQFFIHSFGILIVETVPTPGSLVIVSVPWQIDHRR